MYGSLTYDIARSMVADRERELAQMIAAQRAVGSPSMPRFRDRLMRAARGLRGWKTVGSVEPALSNAAQ